ncbi:MAG: hypothetical protein KAR40_01065 [Candidatus Sabulitectum sp.]|nr:hypothetical protein [Candidatus Sabulitectum sp.]
MTDTSNKAQNDWIAEEADCCLSYGVHPIARCLAEECRKEAELKEGDE